MTLFLPQTILGATLAILLASNLLQRDFRSSWLLAVSGAGLSFTSLIFLRFGLPLSLNASAWWAGEGLISSINFALDDISWTLAFISSGLTLAFLLLEAHRAVTAHWSYWATSLAVAMVGLLSVIAGDWLTLAFFWMLMDTTAAVAVYTVGADTGRRAQLGFLPANVTAIFLLLAAWLLTGYSGEGSSLLVLLAAALRLGIFNQVEVHLESQKASAFLRLVPMASVIGVLARSGAVHGPVLGVTLIILLTPALAHASEFLNSEPGHTKVFERGFGCLGLASAAIGQPAMSLAFGLGLLAASHWDLLAQAAGRLRWTVIAGSGMILAALPFTRLTSADQSIGFNLIASVLFVIEGMLIAGWLRPSVELRSEPTGSEPWMRTIRIFGLAVVPLIFVLLATGLAPRSASVTGISWQAMAAVLLATSVVIVFRSFLFRMFRIPARVQNLINQFLSMRWLQGAEKGLLLLLGWILQTMRRVLEGQAGVLWALLLITLLLSVASQLAPGG